MLKMLNISTKKRDEFYELTLEIQTIIKESGVKEGTVIIYCSHTTAGITINENADPDVKRDMIRRFDEIYPWSHPKDMHMEGNTAAHMKASTVGSSATVIISSGKLVLGTWQGIYFCEFDGPRSRTVYIKITKD